MMLAWLEGLNWENLHSQSIDSEIGKMQSEKDSLSIKNEKLENDLMRYIDSFSEEKDTLLQRVKERMKAIDLEIESNKEKIKEINNEIFKKTDAETAISQGFKQFKFLVSDNSDNGRVRLQLEIRRRIKAINLFRYGGLKYYGIGRIAEMMSKMPAVQIIYQNDQEEQIRFETAKPLGKAIIAWTHEYNQNPTNRKSRDEILKKMSEMSEDDEICLTELSPELEPYREKLHEALKKRNKKMSQFTRDKSKIVFVDKNPFFHTSKGESVGSYMKKF
jgi:hypothetical protein